MFVQKLKDAGLATALVVVGALPVTSFAQSTAATDGAAAVTGLVAGQAGYLAGMIALALASVGILIAVKWVKRARGAA